MELTQVALKNAKSGQYLVVEEQYFNYTDYDGTNETAEIVTVWLMDTELERMVKLTPKSIRAMYKHVEGKVDRMYYWRVMKSMEQQFGDGSHDHSGEKRFA
ncbi:MAG: hypothetical protein ACXACY_14760 [Candidatus Hodarchaeales archaeon]|jgi:hypothetical protein